MSDSDTRSGALNAAEVRSTRRTDGDGSRHLFEHVHMLWEDQVAFAETLRDKRKLYSAGLALFAGLGIFRLNWYRRADEVPIIASKEMEWLIKSLVVGSIVLLMLSAYFLYTERSWIRAELVRLHRRLRRHRPRFAEVLTFAATLAPWLASRLRSTMRPGVDALRNQRRGRAITEMLLTDSDSAELYHSSNEYALLWRAYLLRAAYSRLVAANNRVNARIYRGVFFMGAGYLLLLVGLVVYTLVAV